MKKNIFDVKTVFDVKKVLTSNKKFDVKTFFDIKRKFDVKKKIPERGPQTVRSFEFVRMASLSLLKLNARFQRLARYLTLAG